MSLARVTKYCPGCSTYRPGQCFSVDRSRRDGLSNYCDLCNQERQKQSKKCVEWYAKDANREKQIENMRRRRARGYKPPTPRPKGGFIHLLGDEQKTMCGWPKNGKHYQTVPLSQRIGHITDDNTCSRCRAVYEVLMRCEQLTAEQIITAAHCEKTKG